MIRPSLLCVIALCAGCGNDRGYGSEFNVDGGINGSGRDLPCDVQAFLADHCQSCHGREPVNGAPMALMTYDDLTGKNSAGVMIARRALIRMKNPASQMPPLPAPPATSADIAMFEDWITSGAPGAECVAEPGPFDGPAVCSSGRMWDEDNDESERMHPGRACITCHRREDDAPRLSIGGTVYPTGHEPNDCYGATNAVVEVTDANGNVTMLRVNATGNFLSRTAIAFPIRVAVLANGKRRAMGASPPTGDCNSCHTPTGANGAPGRIVLP